MKSNGGGFLCENHSRFHESMNYDEKERLMIAHYFGLLAENNFTEYDILGFLMVLRREMDKEKYKYIHDFLMVSFSINSIFYFLHKAAEPFNCLEQDNLA